MSLPDPGALPRARRISLRATAAAGANGVLGGVAVINQDALIRSLRAMGLGAEVDAIIAKDAAGGYDQKEHAQ